MRSLYGIPLLILNTIVMGTLSLLSLIVNPSGKLSHVIARYWSRCILYTCGVRVELRGAAEMDRTSSYIVMSNHQSVLDIPILFAYLPLHFRIMAKKILFMIPFLGWHLWLSGHVAIDRKSLRESARGLLKAASKVKGGVSILIFPEGTRSRDGRPGVFKLGGFRLAQEHHLRILPVSIDGSWKILPKGSAWLRPSPPVRLTLHAPVEVRDDEDRAELAASVRATVVGVLSSADAAPVVGAERRA